jgi:hypothetical protein
MRLWTVAVLSSLALLGAGAGSGCSQSGGKDGNVGVGAGAPSIPLEELIDPAPAGVRRLLARQYKSSIALVLGEKAAQAAAPPKDIALHGFRTIGAAGLSFSALDIEAHEKSARAVADAVVKDAAGFAALLPCKPTAADDLACLSQLVGKIGPVLWRRPLAVSENNAISSVALEAAKTYGSFEKGAAYAISALLQAPEFLYIVEIGEKADPKHPERRTLTATELVTRMSFFLLDTTPDAQLLELAQKGGLKTADDIRAVAKQMLARPQAKVALGAYYDEVFQIELVDSTAKNAEQYPMWTPELQKSIHQSALAMLDDIVWARNADAREMVTADYAFIDDKLAPLYGVSAPATMTKTTLPPAQQRAGLLGSPAFLSVFSHAARSSPTKRGVFIRRTLLCDTVQPPPNDVVPQLPEDPNDGLTTKELLSKHMKEPSCKACHQAFDSLGWSLEVFDAVGAHRNADKGKTIDTSGESPNVGKFAGPTDLAKLLYDHKQVPECMVRNLYRNSMGHLETKGEEPAIEALNEAFVKQGFKVQDLLVEIVANPAFRMVGDPK